MDEATIREMINRFYATTVDDVAGSSEIYADDAAPEFPQGKERIRGRANIIAFRSAYPAQVDIEQHRTVGRQDLWVNELTIRYNGANPFNAVSIMEFRGGKVVRARIYYGEPWEPPAWRGAMGRAGGDGLTRVSVPSGPLPAVHPVRSVSLDHARTATLSYADRDGCPG